MLDHRQIRKHLKDLNDPNESTRGEAVRAFKEHRREHWDEVPDEIVTPMVEALRRQLPKKAAGTGKGSLSFVRQEAIGIMGNIGPRASSAVPSFMELLEEGEAHTVREAAAFALGKIGKDAKPAIDKLISVLTPDCRISLASRVARTLGEIGCADQRVRNALVQLWLTPTQNDQFREQVGIALCKLGIEAPSLFATLSKTLVTQSHVSPRKAAAEALSWCDKKGLGVVAALLVAYHDPEEELKALAEQGFERMQITHAKAIQICADQLGECIHSEAALRKVGALAAPCLVKALKNSSAAVRSKSANVLAFLGEAGAAATAALEKTLQDDDPEVRLSAAKALWSVTKQADSVVPTLQSLLKNKKNVAGDDAETRRRFLQSVIEALGRMGPPAAAATSILTEKSRDENRLVRESALRALKMINTDEIGKPSSSVVA